MRDLSPLTWTVTQGQIDAYAGAAGADDPIHVDPAGRVAEGGTIAQGMLVLAVMAEFVAGALPSPGPWLEQGSLDVRFRAPARPGDRLTARAVANAEADGIVTCDLWCENAAGIRIVAGTARIPVTAFAC